MRRQDICGVIIATAFVVLAVALAAWIGHFIGVHLTDPDRPCSYGPKGTVCSLTGFPLGHR